MKESLLLIGGGGHCRSCIDVIEETDYFNVCGIIDQKENIGKTVSGYPIIGCDDDLEKYIGIYENVLITVGQIKTPALRIRLFDIVKKNNGVFPVIVSPYARVSHNAIIGEGTIVMHNAIINAGAFIGKNCIINTSAVIEHDVIIGDNCHVSTGSIVNGECIIGGMVFLGSNSVVRNNLTICELSVIGSGAVVNKEIKEKGVFAGNPIKKIGEI